jgi:hypothetical protein
MAKMLVDDKWSSTWHDLPLLVKTVDLAEISVVDVVDPVVVVAEVDLADLADINQSA